MSSLLSIGPIGFGRRVLGERRRARLDVPRVATGGVLGEAREAGPGLLGELNVERITTRTGGESSGRMEQLKYDPPPSADRGANGERLLQRSDDREGVLLPRLTECAAMTSPLVAWCSSKGLLRRVDSDGAVDAVTAALFWAIGAN